MDLRESIDLDTGAHRFVLVISLWELEQAGALVSSLPDYARLKASEKLSDKLLILSLFVETIERREQQAREDREIV